MPGAIEVPARDMATANGIDGMASTKKPKISKAQARRLKKKDEKAKARESRDTSVVTDSEVEAGKVSLWP